MGVGGAGKSGSSGSAAKGGGSAAKGGGSAAKGGGSAAKGGGSAAKKAEAKTNKVQQNHFKDSFCPSKLENYQDLSKFAKSGGFAVTSTTGGKHNPGSAHGQGKAVDVRTRDHSKAEVDSFINSALSCGIKVRDERTKPDGQAVWSGPHVHLQVP